MKLEDLDRLKFAMNFVSKHPLLYRIYLWWTRPFFCKLGFHKFDWNERGSYICSGVMDFFCSKCQKKIKSIPFDDLPEKHKSPTPSELKQKFMNEEWEE